MEEKGFSGRRDAGSLIIFVLIVLYMVFSVLVLLTAGVVPAAAGLYLNPYVLILSSAVSFGLVALVCAYHLSTIIRRRKRKTDLK